MLRRTLASPQAGLVAVILLLGGVLTVFAGTHVDARTGEVVNNFLNSYTLIQTATDALGRQHPDWDLEVGIGINTGEVIMGATGSKDRMDFTVLGDHVNLASRLCSHARPGQTLVSASTHEAIADCPEFAAEALAPIVVKGKGEPLPVYQVGPGPPTVPERRARASRQVVSSGL